MGLEDFIEDLLGRCFEIVLSPVFHALRRFARSWAKTYVRSNPHALPDLLLHSYRLGDYSNALAMTNLAQKAGMDMSVLRASILMQLGQTDEAVSVLTPILFT